ncbi:pseudouridine synthase [Persicirhabdus sediminis]|uniref:tRNA pseudouridine synthase C n=1 Tax=Persicirhabdus sediminis TaxID=454144 RepID=A0A8J7MIV2_9BACT|nr:pseudouridine synthase [Persicirhabdus sediminis]MBK1791788.1 hypothetical protein [Persicirhabdus sediminis]
MSEELCIIYQDEYLVAVDKPAGHLVHPADVPQDGDLVAMKILRDQIGQHVFPIHRLDRPTSGVLLFGLEKSVTKKLHAALREHEFEKVYWAAVLGKPSADAWGCHQPLRKDDDAPEKSAHTSFRVLTSCHAESLAGIPDIDEATVTLLEAIPHTGRFHQIRRHLLHHGMPIIGDYRYAGIDRSNQLGELLGTGTRMLLQAKKLTITHPATGELLEIEAPVRENFQKCFPHL